MASVLGQGIINGCPVGGWGAYKVVGNGSGDVSYWRLQVYNRISSLVVRRILWSVVFLGWGCSGRGNYPCGCEHWTPFG